MLTLYNIICYTVNSDIKQLVFISAYSKLENISHLVNWLTKTLIGFFYLGFF